MVQLVSIIIPVYNGERHLQQCLQSVISQTHSTIEIIVVNDGSTDNTINILKNIQDERLTVINTENRGACYARNIGFELSKGIYIQFLDADDYLSLNKIEKQLRALANTHQHLAICNTIIINETSDILGSLPEQHQWLKDSESGIEFLLLLYKNYGMIQTNAWLTPRSLVLKAGKWNEKLKQDQDGEFFCRIVIASTGIRYAKNCINYYRKSVKSDSISNNKSADYAKSTIKALDLKSNFILSQKNDKATKEVFAMHYKVLAVRYYGIHPTLYQHAMSKCLALNNCSFVPIMGGRTVQILTRVLGWRLTKKLILFKNGKTI
jgi:glycosyltransferase involved in cell wall biosynthesis